MGDGKKSVINKVKYMPKELKASIAFLFASIISGGISYLTTPIFTRLLSTDEFGSVSVFFSWVSILGIIAMFSLSGGVFNNGMSDYVQDRDRYSFSILVLSNIITLVFGAILLGIYPLIKDIIQLPVSYLVLMIVLFLVQPAYLFWGTRQRFDFNYKKPMFFSVLTALFPPLVAIAAILLFPGYKVSARIYGMELSLILFYTGFYIYIAAKSRLKIKRSYWKEAFLFNLPLIPHYLSIYILNSSDKIMISHIIGDSAVAFYSIAYSVAAVVAIVWNAANYSLIPFTYERCNKKDYAAISKVTMPILTLFAAACLFLILLAPEVVALMATEVYRESIYVIPPIVGGVFFQVQYFMYANILFYYKRPKYVMYASVTSALLNILLNYIFIPKFGYIAAGYTTLASYLVQAAIDYIALRKFMGFDVYNMSYIGGLSTLVILIAVFSNFTYDYVLVRYIGIAALILGAIIFRKKIIAMFKIMKAKEVSDET